MKSGEVYIAKIEYKSIPYEVVLIKYIRRDFWLVDAQYRFFDRCNRWMAGAYIYRHYKLQERR